MHPGATINNKKCCILNRIIVKMNTKTFIVWFLLIAAVIVAVTADSSVDNKKEGAKQVEIPNVEPKGDAAVEAPVEEEKDSNYEVDNRGGGGWKGGGGQGGGWKGGGGRGGGGGWKGGGGRGGGGGWKGGGGRGGGGGGGAELAPEEINDVSDDLYLLFASAMMNTSLAVQYNSPTLHILALDTVVKCMNIEVLTSTFNFMPET
ncbi:unnamed protein product, partial [Thlaspi arvense]